MSLGKYGDDVAENTRTWGGRPGSVQPEACAGCGSSDRMSFSTARDGRKYWSCDHCEYLHESDETQGTAKGMSAYANKFKVGDFVHRRGDWDVYRVDRVYRSGNRDEGYFHATLVVDGLKYHKPGKAIFENASYYERLEDPAAYVASHGHKFVPDFGQQTKSV